MRESSRPFTTEFVVATSCTLQRLQAEREAAGKKANASGPRACEVFVCL